MSDPYVALGASPAPTMIAQYATTVRQLTLYEPDSGEVTYLPGQREDPFAAAWSKDVRFLAVSRQKICPSLECGQRQGGRSVQQRA